MNQHDDLMKIPEFMDFTGLSRGKAYELVHQSGFFPAIRLGKSIRISRSRFERWMDQQGGEEN